MDSLAPTMPPKETYPQIKERNAREIRNRTRDRIATLMINEAAQRRRMLHCSSDSDRDDSQAWSDEDDYIPRTKNRRTNMLPDAINAESANPGCSVSRNESSIWIYLYLLSFITTVLIFNVLYLQHYLLKNSALQ
jgi:hypothetical protein